MPICFLLSLTPFFLYMFLSRFLLLSPFRFMHIFFLLSFSVYSFIFRVYASERGRSSKIKLLQSLLFNFCEKRISIFFFIIILLITSSKNALTKVHKPPFFLLSFLKCFSCLTCGFFFCFFWGILLWILTTINGLKYSIRLSSFLFTFF